MGSSGSFSERDLIEPARRDAERLASVFGRPLAGPTAFPGCDVIREVHRGGQGVVYEAVQRSTKRTVAIKILHQRILANPRTRARFEREVQLLGQFRHPNIVAIHDSGTTDERFYYVMDYIAGQPLDRFLDHKRHSVRQILGVFAKVCDAVSAAHLRGVIHRDLKPGNIRVDAEGEPVVLDFGLAKVTAEDKEDPSTPPDMTETGQFVGSLPWASPEQVEGRTQDIDVRSDVYSLGVVLYRLLTGVFPYQVSGPPRTVIENILYTPPASPRTLNSAIGDEVETIVLKCLSKDRERRYQSAGELARDVWRYLAGEPIEAKRDSGWYVLRKTLRRYRLVVVVAGTFLVLVMSATVALSIMYRTAVEAETAAEQARDAESRQRTLADQRYEEIVRLADRKRLADARSAADVLWPAHPEKIEAMKMWLATQAVPLRDNLPQHEATLQALRTQALDYDSAQERHDRETHPRAAELDEQRQQLADFRKQHAEATAKGTDDGEVRARKIEELEKSIAEAEQSIAELEQAVKERRTWKFADEETHWQYDMLAGLVQDLKEFLDPDPRRGTVASVRERIEFASHIAERSITGSEVAARWAEAIADFARLEVYGGLQLTPQVALVPLRPDPRSGLWEFWHVQTGTEPEENPDADAVNPWVLTGDTGLIFVLIPGGTFWMGAQKEDPDGRNYDPQREPDESPVHEVTLAAFFISKYEMTQGQWQRFTGVNPSNYPPNWSWSGDLHWSRSSERPAEPPLNRNEFWNPVEHITWTECQRVLEQLGLLLPTEAQWEYAARAGTSTVWWTGNEKESIGVEGAGNLADGWTKRKGGARLWVYEDWLEDGWRSHAPVGSFQPNGFGLHDVIGNVSEFCRDWWGRYDEADVEPGDGLRKITRARTRVGRGGSFRLIATYARSATRISFRPETAITHVGVRPARSLTK